MQQENVVNELENKNDFLSNLVVRKDEEEEKLIKLQDDYKNENILEEDIPEDTKEKLLILYKKQNEEIKKKIE